jgi:hypothetical protein
MVLALGVCPACGATTSGDDAGLDAIALGDAPLDAGLPACEVEPVDVVRGRVVDALGAPVDRARPQLCVRLIEGDRLVCLMPPFTNAEGRFEIRVPTEVRCMRSAAMRVLVTGGSYGTSYCPIDLAPMAGVLELSEGIELFEVERASLPAYGDPGAVREVPLGDALVVTLAPESIGDEADHARLGAVRVDPARSCVPAARALDGLLVSMPEKRLAAPFRVLATELPAGSRVELFVIGGLDTELADGTVVPEAELARLGAGTVSDDGTLTPEPTVLLPQLGWLGWSVAR